MSFKIDVKDAAEQAAVAAFLKKHREEVANSYAEVVKKNPLITHDEYLARMKNVDMRGRNWVRGSGRTTSLALEYLGRAIGKPGTPIQLVDHDGGSVAYLVGVILRIAEDLGLQHLHTYWASSGPGTTIKGYLEFKRKHPHESKPQVAAMPRRVPPSMHTNPWSNNPW